MISIRGLAKFLFERAGYTVRKRSGLHYGVDLWLDIQRLSVLLKRPVGVVFDVGANKGDTSLEALKNFPSSQVYAFEPHPGTYNTLAARITNHAFTPSQLALSDKIGLQSFFDYGGSGHINSLVRDARFSERFETRGTEIHVQVDTIDNFCRTNNLDKISILKIDTEGNDYSVLRGAEGMLKSNSVDFAYFEFNDFEPKPGTTGGSLNEISAYLATFDFHFIATYTDRVVTEGELFVVANALLVRSDN